MTEHTPTPWSSNGVHPYSVRDGTVTVEHDKPHQKYVIKHVYRDDQGRRTTVFLADVLVTSGREPEAEANAAFIVKAVNSHDALVKALRELLEATKHQPVDMFLRQRCEAALDATSAAK